MIVESDWQSSPSTLDDLENLWSNLAERLKEEFRRAKELFPNLSVKSNVRTLIDAGQSLSFRKNGQLRVILTWEPVTEGFATTFLATDAYFSRRLSDIRYSRDAIAHLQKQLGNTALISNSLGEHRSRDAWFRAMGYEKLPVSLPYAVFVRRPVSAGE